MSYICSLIRKYIPYSEKTGKHIEEATYKNESTLNKLVNSNKGNKPNKDTCYFQQIHLFK
jgi:hypothetical protein